MDQKQSDITVSMTFPE